MLVKKQFYHFFTHLHFLTNGKQRVFSVLKSQLWLSVSFRIDFKIPLLVFKRLTRLESFSYQISSVHINPPALPDPPWSSSVE